MSVKMWQDTGMEKPEAPAPVPVRSIDNVDALKALADPTRLAILQALMKSRHDLPVMSVKELAAELGEPQTKLYRHVRQLEAAGLIKVASSRMVSGILEQRYQASQQELMFASGFIQEHADESMAATQVAFDAFLSGFFAVYSGSAEGSVPPDELFRKPKLFLSDMRVSAARASQIRSKLEEIIASLDEEDAEDPDGVPLNLFMGYYVSAGPART
jgi:DNA-binding transcriptional ArsR family regulator